MYTTHTYECTQRTHASDLRGELNYVIFTRHIRFDVCFLAALLLLLPTFIDVYVGAAVASLFKLVPLNCLHAELQLW